jgi:hypothetical protein
MNDIEKVFNYDHDFASIYRQIKPMFIDSFDKAIDLYIDGEWYGAFEMLSKAQGHNTKDGPTIFLLDYLEKNKNLKPDSWENARYIDEVAKPPDVNYDN